MTSPRDLGTETDLDRVNPHHGCPNASRALSPPSTSPDPCRITRMRCCSVLAAASASAAAAAAGIVAASTGRSRLPALPHTPRTPPYEPLTSHGIWFATTTTTTTITVATTTPLAPNTSPHPSSDRGAERSGASRRRIASPHINARPIPLHLSPRSQNPSDPTTAPVVAGSG